MTTSATRWLRSSPNPAAAVRVEVCGPAYVGDGQGAVGRLQSNSSNLGRMRLGELRWALEAMSQRGVPDRAEVKFQVGREPDTTRSQDIVIATWLPAEGDAAIRGEGGDAD
ncbi:MAG: hypothetical protein M3024_12730 [Candidatus Dormibacteraeota bacterium]|nr:hypothetical protein [Candidatus Dormibacteraeota bacterium]